MTKINFYRSFVKAKKIILDLDFLLEHVDLISNLLCHFMISSGPGKILLYLVFIKDFPDVVKTSGAVLIRSDKDTQWTSILPLMAGETK